MNMFVGPSVRDRVQKLLTLLLSVLHINREISCVRFGLLQVPNMYT